MSDTDTAAREGSVVSSFTSARRRPNEIGQLHGISLPWTFTFAQVGVGAAGVALAVALISFGVPKLVAIVPTVVAVFLSGRAVRRVRIDDRAMLPGLMGKARQLSGRQRPHRVSKQRTVDVIRDNAVIGADHSMWLLFAVNPLPFGNLASTATRLEAVAAVEKLVGSLQSRRWRLVSEMRRIDPDDIARAMQQTSNAPTWAVELDAERERLSGMPMTARRFTLMVDIGDARPRSKASPSTWLRAIGRAAGVSGPARCDWIDPDAVAAHSARIVASAPPQTQLRPLGSGDIRTMLARIPGEPPPVDAADDDWEHLASTQPAEGARLVGGRGEGSEGASAWTLGRAQWSEPRPGIAVADTGAHATAFLSAVLSSTPDRWLSPGGGEPLWRLDFLAEAWEWVIDAEVIAPSVAKARSRNQARQLAGQVEQYDGDAAGAPPELAVAAMMIDEQRAQLASRHDAAEYITTVVMTTQMPLPDRQLTDKIEDKLRERLGRLSAVAASIDMAVAAPTGDQVWARRAFSPHRCAGQPVLRDYRQYLLADGVAGLGPAMQARIGDPRGCVLGMVDERGTVEPLLFDPTLGPRGGIVGASPQSPALAVTGALGRGKSVFAKRTTWTGLAAGGNVVAIDRGDQAEYRVFAEALAEACPELGVTIIDVRSPDAPSIDPMRSGLPREDAAAAAVRLISVVAGLNPRSSHAARLQRTAVEMPGIALVDVIEAARADQPDDPEWVRIADLIAVMATDPIGSVLFDPKRPPARLDADLVVLAAKGLSLSDEAVTPSDLAAGAVVLGMMLLARGLVFADVDRFSALLLDEAWALVKDPRARQLITEMLRDGRKHNAAVWMVSQSPTDFLELGQLSELFGYVALFGVENYEAAVNACALAGIDETLGASTLMDLEKGQMLWRDIWGRTGLVDVLLPADPDIAHAVLTDPGGSAQETP